MIRRAIWFVLGVTMGGWLVLRAKSLVRRFAPRTVSDHATSAAVAVRDFAGDVRTAMSARETELREVLGMTGGDDATGGTHETKDGH
jgi:hypothetical protein